MPLILQLEMQQGSQEQSLLCGGLGILEAEENEGLLLVRLLLRRNLLILPLEKLWQFSLWLPSHPGPLLVDGDIFFLNFWRFEIRQDGTIPWELRVTYVGFNIPTYCPISININK